ncbi:MAG TPA: hypothetical protein VF644_14240 [Pyrinomonadaceae bacterium]|jgi:hypothetical protein
MGMRYSHAGADSRAMQAIDGRDNGHKLSREKLREIFDSLRSCEMSFDEFAENFITKK